MTGRCVRFAALLFIFFAGFVNADPVEDEASGGDPDYSRGVQALEAKDWKGAIKLLSAVALRDTRNADVQNYLAYAYRNSGELPLAFKHYSRALELNPRHRGAHEYLGEAYLLIGNLPKAEEHLAALKQICLIPCEEYGHLARRLSEYRKREGIN